MEVTEMVSTKETGTKIGTQELRLLVSEIKSGNGEISQYKQDEENFPHFHDRYLVKGDAKYSIHFGTKDNLEKETVELVSQFSLTGKKEKVECEVQARIWITAENADGGPVGTCYKLIKGPDGKLQWMVQTSDKLRKDNGINYWTLGENKPADDKEIRLLTHQIADASNMKPQKTSQN